MRKLVAGAGVMLLSIFLSQFANVASPVWGVVAACAAILMGFGLATTSDPFRRILAWTQSGRWWKKMVVILSAGLITGILGALVALIALTNTREDRKADSATTTPALSLPQTTSELEAHLREQVQFLLRSSSLYDAGNESEAKRIASCLRILLHDSENSYGLLTQLRIKDSLLLANSIDPDSPGNTVPFTGLVKMLLSTKEAQYSPFLDFPTLPPYGSPVWKAIYGDIAYPQRFIPFEQWWTAVAIDDKKGSTLSRGELILAVAEQDGGVAVSSRLDGKYSEISRRNSRWWRSNSNPERADAPIKFLELASIRQIGWEVAHSLQRQFPQYCPSVRERFREDFSYLQSRITVTDLTSNKTGETVKLEAMLLLHQASRSKFISFLVPRTGRSFAVCHHIAHQLAKPEVVATYGPPDIQVTDKLKVSDFEFSGNVYVYHESVLALDEIEKLQDLFRQEGLRAHFIGPEV